MGDYFKPVRRRIGILTLLFASVFAASWVRSIRVDDLVDAYAGRRSTENRHYYDLFSVVSAHGTLYLGKIWAASDDVGDIDEMERYYRYPRWFADHDPGFPSDDLRYVWKCLGFGVYERGPGDPFNGGWRLVIPYWSVVIPLTLLSAYLLVSRPRTVHARKAMQTGG